MSLAVQTKSVKAITRNNSIDEAIKQWLYGKSPSTIRNYSRVIKNYIDYLGDIHVVNSSKSDLRDYMELLAGQGSSTNTLNTYGNIIKSFFSFLNVESHAITNITANVKVPKPVSAVRERILSRQEIDAMVTLETNQRNRLILQLLFFCGLRVSELTSLKWSDVKDNGSTAYVHVTGKGNKQRTLIIPVLLWQQIKAFKGNADNNSPVFPSRKGGNHLTQKAVWDVVSTASNRIGISASPHWLRHTHATLALQNGADVHQVSTSLGHASIATTSKYLHARPDNCSSLYL